MPLDFHLFEIYHSLCQGKTTLDDMLIQSDQQVPQTMNDAQVDNSTTTFISEVSRSDFEDSILEDFTCPNLLAPSAGCTTVTAVPDQQLHGGSSPCHITNLDAYSGTDATLYDQGQTECTKQEMQKFENVMLVTPFEESMDDEVSEVLYHIATKDILDQCKMLQISKDPTTWSVQDVGRWITHMCDKYGILDVDIDKFNVNGHVLCMLSECDFLWRTEHGTLLKAQLDIWKNYYKIESEQTESATVTNRYHDSTSVDSYQFETYSSGPSSPGGSSLDSVPRASPVTCRPLDDFLIAGESSPDETPRRTEHKQTIHLWQFLKELLMKPASFSSCIKWIDRSKGIFKIEDSGRVAKEWGRRKNRPAMNYDKLSRSIRQYYKKGIIKKTEHSKRLVYQFCAPYL